MAYIPKSKIKTNLFTNGGEYTTADNKNYVGPYYKLSTGKAYSGDTPNATDSVELFFVSNAPPIFGSGDLFPDIGSPYNSFDVPELALENLAVPYNPILPTSKDYQNKEFVRYFSVKRNEPLFTEISKNTYNSYKTQHPNVPWRVYKVFTLPWQLTGDIIHVAKTNKNMTDIAEFKESAPGLSTYLKNNWIQYFRLSEANNLYTDGKSDLILKTHTGQVYVGLYHIHPDKGYMVGATHTNVTHDSLIAYYQGQKVVDFQPYVPPKQNSYDKNVMRYNNRINNINNKLNNLQGGLNSGGNNPQEGINLAY